MAGGGVRGSRCVCIIACNFWPPCCECHLMSATLPQPSTLPVQGPTRRRRVVAWQWNNALQFS